MNISQFHEKVKSGSQEPIPLLTEAIQLENYIFRLKAPQISEHRRTNALDLALDCLPELAAHLWQAYKNALKFRIDQGPQTSIRIVDGVA